MRIRMGGEEMDVIDISGTGVLIDGAHDWIVPGQAVHFYFLIMVKDVEKTVPASGVVIRNDGRGLAIHYESPHPNWGRLLTDYLKRHG